MPREPQDDALALANAAHPAALDAGRAADVRYLFEKWSRDLAFDHARRAAFDAHDEGVAMPQGDQDGRDHERGNEQDLNRFAHVVHDARETRRLQVPAVTPLWGYANRKCGA